MNRRGKNRLAFRSTSPFFQKNFAKGQDSEAGRQTCFKPFARAIRRETREAPPRREVFRAIGARGLAAACRSQVFRKKSTSKSAIVTPLLNGQIWLHFRRGNVRLYPSESSKRFCPLNVNLTRISLQGRKSLQSINTEK